MSVLRPYVISILIIVIPFSITHAGELHGKPRTIDGDTIEISGKRVRLHGIDAPESKQACRNSDGVSYRCGTMATFALAELVGDHWVKCVGDENDRYGRLIATCFTGPVNLNEEMVRRGWALAYRRYSSDYILVEGDARVAHRGLWQGKFINPWDWRRGIRLQVRTSLSAMDTATEVPDPNCRIKGNISRSGARIYHMPGTRHYAKTRINTTYGERWFCSKVEAERAGWRAPK